MRGSGVQPHQIIQEGNDRDKNDKLDKLSLLTVD
jgi:hypothetical protein